MSTEEQMHTDQLVSKHGIEQQLPCQAAYNPTRSSPALIPIQGPMIYQLDTATSTILYPRGNGSSSSSWVLACQESEEMGLFLPQV